MNPLQEQCLATAQEHYEHDEIVKGKYWCNGKGCNIGCVAETEDEPHRVWLEKMDLPESVEWLPQLGDTIFEGLPNGEAKEFVLDFHYSVASKERSIKEWDRIRREFLIFTLKETLKHEPQWRKEDPQDHYTTKVIQAVNGSIDYLSKDSPTEEERSAARSAALSAALSAAWSAAESAALSAALSAAWSAESAARSAESAARSAALSADSAALSAARSAESAESAAYQRMSEELIQLLRETRK